jgi:hypothetical protein
LSTRRMCLASGRSATTVSCSTRTVGTFAWTFRRSSRASFISPRGGPADCRWPSVTSAGNRHMWNTTTLEPVGLARSWATRIASRECREKSVGTRIFRKVLIRIVSIVLVVACADFVPLGCTTGLVAKSSNGHALIRLREAESVATPTVLGRCSSYGRIVVPVADRADFVPVGCATELCAGLLCVSRCCGCNRRSRLSPTVTLAVVRPLPLLATSSRGSQACLRHAW